MTIAEFAEVFVASFPADSSRQQLFGSYTRFVADFKEQVTPRFVHWIDGSFVTRGINPADIDFVTLIPYEVVAKKRDLIDACFRRHAAGGIYAGVDAYVLEYFPEGHPERYKTLMDEAYWLNWFSMSRRNRAMKRFPKGFVCINYD